MPGTAGYLYDRSSDLLSASAAGLAAVRTGQAAPGRTYVAWGDPAAEFPLDCSTNGQLTVHLDQQKTLDLRERPIAGRGTPGFSGRSRPGLILVAPLVVTLFRCWPEGNANTVQDPAELAAAAKGLQTDLHCLVQWLVAKRAAHTLFPTSPYPVELGDVGIGNPRTIAPSGGVAGFTVPVDLFTKDPGP